VLAAPTERLRLSCRAAKRLQKFRSQCFALFSPTEVQNLESVRIALLSPELPLFNPTTTDRYMGYWLLVIWGWGFGVWGLLVVSG